MIRSKEGSLPEKIKEIQLPKYVTRWYNLQYFPFYNVISLHLHESERVQDLLDLLLADFTPGPSHYLQAQNF